MFENTFKLIEAVVGYDKLAITLGSMLNRDLSAELP